LFSLRLLEREPENRSLRAVLVHPFLRVPTLRGRATIGTVAALSGLPRLHRWLVRGRHLLERLSHELIHVSDEEILASFQLAFHESRTIARDRSPIAIPAAIRERVRVFHGSNDAWCTRRAAAELAAQVETVQCDEPHGFVTEARYRESLFRRMIAG
jgi:hypothetical protein